MHCIIIDRCVAAMAANIGYIFSMYIKESNRIKKLPIKGDAIMPTLKYY